MIDIQPIKLRFGIIGHSPLLNHAIKVAAQVAGTDMSVLITGESGTGKESFSKIIHQLSTRKHATFIAINCGAIPEGTINSELFGHEKGSFTGAAGTRKGYFEESDGGTIFLDEIGEMPLDTQAMLLRVLENGEFIKVGSSKPQKTNVRVVAATNARLVQDVEDGKFREDLYYRLNTVPIFVPPLRDRENDIELLFRKFAGDFSERYRSRPIILDEEAKQILLAYPFPGNVRQLKNLVEQMSVLEADNRNINAEILKSYLPKNAPRANTLPALLGNEQAKDNFSERDLLYKILFEMRRDVTELKQLVLSILEGQGSAGMLQKYEHLFDDVDKNGDSYSDKNSNLPLYLNTSNPNSANYNQVQDQQDNTTIEYAKEVEDENLQEPKEEPEEETLSLEKKEKEMIIKALDKNNNRRKYAAQDLGISERTLYRKIKQYELDK
ncbi:response regulator with CheY-like receiver, AAA-type ATPase, and DNA-binding domains [Bernardetia litoralis DSM 6794]|uniref:Response regulator with CheY-like receiver, AAA-type ATPase, and DNA-binding domains n=1 Tax=Bernardetia litoralis (strain ATCC 23117 / DSM 6794 / NBRC 15988 / NCIMB 1366 / Fx l1 / Sio-4) TaxID=880071 RepID=I4AIR0_BERLS|nr:sigma-54 dependent transcriptional regulator [Bernardetia litoralis]AFM03845.1 response regulator with CheY-like receiver, AAA-type ATPase, and DNA-binding domains [Bernardetia litoralis DSM 6794]